MNTLRKVKNLNHWSRAHLVLYVLIITDYHLPTEDDATVMYREVWFSKTGMSRQIYILNASIFVKTTTDNHWHLWCWKVVYVNKINTQNFLVSLFFLCFPQFAFQERKSKALMKDIFSLFCNPDILHPVDPKTCLISYCYLFMHFINSTKYRQHVSFKKLYW